MIWNCNCLAKVNSDIQNDTDLLEKYKKGLRAEKKRKNRNAKKIAWYEEHIKITADALRRHMEYKQICESRQQIIFQNMYKQY